MFLNLTLRVVAVGLLLGLPLLATAQERFLALTPNPDEWDCAVRGRVVDDANRPIAHAMIVLDDVHQIFFSESDANGNFVRESHCSRSPIKRFLFATSPFVLGGIVPIDSPEYRFWKLGPAFAGKPIVLKRNEVLDVGDVRAQVYYSKVTITFQNSGGKQLFGADVDWRTVWLRVRNQQGRVVSETGMSLNNLETHVRKVENVVEMFLPEGDWYFEISPFENKGPWFKSSVPVNVRRSNQSLVVTLLMVK
jgi:hypothetical protein